MGDDRAIDRSVGQIATSEQVRDIYQRANDLYEKRDYLGAIVLYDKLLAASRVTPRLVNPYDVRRSRAMAYCKVGRFVEAEQELKQLLDILRSHGGSVSGSQVMYWYLVAHYKGNEKKAMDEWLRL